jgi:hypothetical protein
MGEIYGCPLAGGHRRGHDCGPNGYL